MRVAKYWNRIPDDVKLSADVDKFKIKLENYKKERFEVKGNYWELSDGIFDRIKKKKKKKKNVANGQWCYPGDQIQKCKNKLALHKARKRKRQNNLRVF